MSAPATRPADSDRPSARPAPSARPRTVGAATVAPERVSGAQAVVRSLEELGVDVSVGAALDDQVPLRDDLVLVAVLATIVDGTPRPVEHEALRWCDAAELRELADRCLLVPADAVWVPQLLDILGQEAIGA